MVTAGRRWPAQTLSSALRSLPHDSSCESVVKMKCVCALNRCFMFRTSVILAYHWVFIFRKEIRTYWTFCATPFQHIQIRSCSLLSSSPLCVHHPVASNWECGWKAAPFYNLQRSKEHMGLALDYPVDNDILPDAKPINQTANAAIRMKKHRSQTCN